MLSNKQFITVSNADECRATLKNPQATVMNMSAIIEAISKVTGVEYPWLYGFACESPFNLNGQKHKEVRRMMASYLSSKRIKSWEPAFREIASNIVASSLTEQKIDLLRDWVTPITAQCSYYAFGLNTEIDESFTSSIDHLLLLTSFQRQFKIKDFAVFDYSAKIAAETIRNNRIEKVDYALQPQPEHSELEHNDLYNYLVCNFGLPADLVCSQMSIALGAGTSTKHTLANVLVELLTLPISARKEHILTLGIDELLERTLYVGGGVEFIYRSLNGDEVHCLNIAAANRDVIGCPFSNTEKPESKHLAFGYGAHKCIGEMLSRQIMTIALEVIFEHCPNAMIYNRPKSQVFTHTPSQDITVELRTCATQY